MRFTVYTSSSDAVDERFRAAARAFGYRLGERGDALVYGGTDVGLMGVLAQATREAGGHVTGALPQLMAERGLADHDCDELLITDGMGDRKRAMYERADAFVALPGGFGTIEELLEVLTLRQLGYHRKPIVLLDVAGALAGIDIRPLDRLHHDVGVWRPSFDHRITCLQFGHRLSFRRKAKSA